MTTEKMAAQRLPWEELPDDLWVDIFFRLERSYTGRRHLRSVSMVCKRFLILSNRTQKKLILSPAKGDLVPLASLCNRFAALTAIRITRPDSNLDASITQLASSNLQLQSLYLSHQTLFPRNAMRLLGQSMSKTLKSLSCTNFELLVDDDLVIVAEFFPYLHKFDVCCAVYGGKITDKGIHTISTQLCSLISLNISDQHYITRRSIDYLSSNCHLLQTLSAGCCCCYFGNGLILDQFLSFRSLSSLHLRSVMISDDMLAQVSAANWKMLQKLTLDSPKSTDDIHIKGSALCKFLKSCASLRSLELRCIFLEEDATAADFAASIPNIESVLWYFELPWNDAYEDEDHVVRPILYNLLKHCPLLTRIGASYSSIGSAPEWFDIPVRCSIKILYLCCSDDLSDETLALIASKCPMLEILYIDDSPKITARGTEAVQKSCSKIKLFSVQECDNCPDLWLKKDFSDYGQLVKVLPY